MSDKPPAVMVAVPATEVMYTRAVAALMQLRLPRGEIRFETGLSSIASKRQRFAEDFMNDPRFTHLLFLDSDQVPPSDTLERLLAHQLPLVSAAVFTRVPPHFICAYQKAEHADWESLGHLGPPDPVRRMTKIPRPWFEHPVDEPGAGEDTHFCVQAEKAGIPIYVDTTLVVGHLTVVSVDLDYVAGWQHTGQAKGMLEALPGFAAGFAEAQAGMAGR